MTLFTSRQTRLNGRHGGMIAPVIAVGGCDLRGPQSALSPAGVGAEQISTLFWWMAGGAVLIWAVVIGIALYATLARPRKKHDVQGARWLIIGGGIVFPTVVLTILLSYGLMLIPKLRFTGDVDLHVAVSGEMWWWRVRYTSPSGEPIELANEIRLPVGKRVSLSLTSPDVIHSFWVPSLSGKVDMIPGRENTLILEPTKPGTYRGACAEYCGASHAFMALRVVVMEPQDFKAWLTHQAQSAVSSGSPLARQGEQAFLVNGCGACHTVRGTAADGRVGPDLTHVGSRLSLGAGMLPNDAQTFARWIGHTEQIKPEVRMPSFGMLPEEQLTALATYLSGLK
ncbi:cytochrome c oxidase subunit II [Pseudomonas luteola]|nr:cytochrome c oxidase subunit II [Pseudomonas zeshuii]